MSARRVSPHVWVPLLVFAALLVAGLTHGTLFSAMAGYRAVYTGIVVGTVTVLITWRFNLGPRLTVLTVVIGALLASGVGALPYTSYWGVVPTYWGLVDAVKAAITSWKDLLTVAAPVPHVSDTLLMPYTAGVISASMSMGLAIRSRHHVMALLPVFFLASVGVLWGTHHAPLAPIVGAAGGLVALGIVVRSLRFSEAPAAEDTIQLLGERRYGRTRAVGSAIILVLVACLGGGGAYAFTRTWSDADRIVLRDYFEPQVDVRQYSSPVSQFRAWKTLDAEVELFTVAGIAPESRIRLATLDTYDGTVFRVSDGASSHGETTFRKVFSRFDNEALTGGRRLGSMDVTVGVYSGHWLLGADTPRAIEYAGPRAQALQDALYYSAPLSTLLTTVPLKAEDRYTVEYVVPTRWTDSQLEQARIASMTALQDEFVPREIAQVATEMTDGANIGLEQIRAIQHKLSSLGFYSDGSDGMSRPGHRADRLAHFLSAQFMVGDDDQYAPTMVLMLRSLGIPARLAMGFIPEEEGEQVAVRGRDSRMWVEVPFEELGWVPFDPTPPKDQTLRTEVPKPKPQIRPQVVQPPDPPADPAEIQADEVPDLDDKKDEEPPRLSWLFIVGTAVGIVGLLIFPILLIAGLKALRALRRRRKGDPEMRSVAAWDELVDRVRDLGITVTKGEARVIQAHMIEHQVFADRDHDENASFRRLADTRTDLEVLADDVDAAVFGAHYLSDEQAKVMWQRMYDIAASARTHVSWKRRLRALFTPATLFSRWTRPTPHQHLRGATLDTSEHTRLMTRKDDTDG